MLREGRRAFAYQFRWTPDLGVGVPEINAQHKAWLGRVNDLCKSVLAGAGSEDLGSLTDFLADYTRWHFSDEESLMLKHDYPDFDAHMQSHEDLANRVQVMKDLVTSERVSTDSLVSIITNLHDWFSKHMKEKDRVFGEWLRDVSPEKVWP